MSVAKVERSRLKPDDRRRHIVQSTITSLATHGPQRCTLRQVARDAGVAPSLITYFFSTWPGLLLNTYQELAQAHEREIEALKDRFGDDAERNMTLFLETFFSDHWTGDRVAGAHISLWALARGDVDLSGEMTKTTHSLKELTNPLIKALCNERRCDTASTPINETFYALTSGLWYEIAVNPSGLNQQNAINLVWNYLNTAIPNRKGV